MNLAGTVSSLLGSTVRSAKGQSNQTTKPETFGAMVLLSHSLCSLGKSWLLWLSLKAVMLPFIINHHSHWSMTSLLHPGHPKPGMPHANQKLYHSEALPRLPSHRWQWRGGRKWGIAVARMHVLFEAYVYRAVDVIAPKNNPDSMACDTGWMWAVLFSRPSGTGDPGFGGSVCLAVLLLCCVISRQVTQITSHL